VPLDTGALINVQTQEDDEHETFDPVPDNGELKVIAETDNDRTDFGDRSDLRNNMGITDPDIDAHHLIPWDLQDHPLVQLGAQAGWDMNEAYNGMALSNPHAVAGHRNYNNYVDRLLDLYYMPEMTAEDADQALMHITEHMRGLIKSNDPRRIR